MGGGGPKVLDISDGIPGAYAALLLHHAGATVARGEASGGDPMRRWRLAPGEPHGDGALYRYLRQGQTAVRMDEVPDDADGADVLLASPDAGRRGAAAGDRRGSARPHDRRRHCVRADRTARAPPGQRPHRPGRERRAGASAAGPTSRRSRWAAARSTGSPAPTRAWPRFVGWRRARGRHGRGLFVDLARCDVANLGACNFMDLMHAIGHGVDGATGSVRCGGGRRRRSSRPPTAGSGSTRTRRTSSRASSG